MLHRREALEDQAGYGEVRARASPPDPALLRKEGIFPGNFPEPVLDGNILDVSNLSDLGKIIKTERYIFFICVNKKEIHCYSLL